MPDLPDLGRALQDQVSDVFRQKRARHVGWYVVYELRRDVDDEFVRFVLQAMFIAYAAIHNYPRPGNDSLRAGFYQRAGSAPERFTGYSPSEQASRESKPSAGLGCPQLLERRDRTRQRS
jgi:hypothetical protein